MNNFEETFSKLVDSYSELDLDNKKEALFMRIVDLIESFDGENVPYNSEANKDFEEYLKNVYLLTFKLENSLSKFLIDDNK